MLYFDFFYVFLERVLKTDIFNYINKQIKLEMTKKKLSILTTLLLMAATGAVAQSPYSVTLKEGTEDADKWKIDPISAEAGVPVSATYSGTKHVKSVKYVKKLRTPVVTAPTAKSLTYSGSAQELVNAGSTTGGTMQYKVGSGSYSAEIPTATNAGTYTVYYKVVGGEAYSDVDEASVSVTIKAVAAAKSDKTKWAVGDIICTNGNAYTISANTTIPTGVTPVAIVAYKGSKTGDASYTNGLAFALKDGNSGCWKSSKGTKDNDNQPINATTSESGRAITYKQQTYGKRSDGTAESRETWTAFYNSGYNYGVSYPSSATSQWFLPSIYQWNQMVKGLLGVTKDLTTTENTTLTYDKINAKLQIAINDANVKAVGLLGEPYWTASENHSNNTYRGWCYRATGKAGYNDKDASLHVRPVLAF